MSFEEFQENFTNVIICHYIDHYALSSKPIEDQEKYRYYKLTADKTGHYRLYLTQKGKDVKSFNSYRVLVYDDKNKTILGGNWGQEKFLDVDCGTLKQGQEYKIMIELDDTDQDQLNCNLSIYGAGDVTFDKIND